jgi:MFS family permease
MDKGTSCGLFNWRPEWAQKLASQKVYLALFFVIGVVQSMSFSYLTVVLSTIEKRFGLKSREATWIYSGNEISQIFFILFLPFVGRVKKRPLFMGVSIMLSAIGLLIIAFPHFTGEQTYLVDINDEVIITKKHSF